MKIAVAAGHTPSGTAGCGAVGVLDESKCTREVAKALESILSKEGQSTKLLIFDRGNNYNCEDCYVRAQQANDWGAELYVEIHFNSADGGATGTEVEVSGFGGQAEQYAKRVAASISADIGLRNRGVNERNLIVLNKTNMPAILVECSFVENPDAQKYNASKYAQAIAKGILNKGTVSAPSAGGSTSGSGSNSGSSNMGIVNGANCVVKNDFFYTRNSNGDKVGGRVDIGDKIKVIDVSYSKQLCYVEYPVSGGTKKAYIKNSPNCLAYMVPWKASGYRDVFDNDKKTKIGSISSGELCYVLEKTASMWNIVYSTNKGTNTKSGWIYI